MTAMYRGSVKTRRQLTVRPREPAQVAADATGEETMRAPLQLGLEGSVFVLAHQAVDYRRMHQLAQLRFRGEAARQAVGLVARRRRTFCSEVRERLFHSVAQDPSPTLLAPVPSPPGPNTLSHTGAKAKEFQSWDQSQYLYERTVSAVCFCGVAAGLDSGDV